MSAERQRIREFLNEWDPIGVNPVLLEAGKDLDEYEDYVGTLMAASSRGMPELQVALTKMLEDMGLTRSVGEVQLRAQQLVARLGRLGGKKGGGGGRQAPTH